jgi:hypothetical protein
MLGFSERVRDAAREGNTDEFLSNLKMKLEAWYGLIRDDRGLGGRRFWELKVFTDNVVLGIPIQNETPAQALIHLVHSIETLQRGLTLDAGYFIRGGIAMGDLYIDDSIVYGTALLDAQGATRHLS